MGHEVTIFCTSNKSEIPISGISVQNFRKSRNVFSVSPLLFDTLQRCRPDILHFHSGFIPRSTSIAKWARRQSIPYAVTPNGNCSVKLLQRRPAFKIPYWYMFEKPYLDRAAFIHAVGDRRQIEHLKVCAPIVDAQNGIDLNALPSASNASLILERLPHWANRKIFLFIGRLDVRQKGLDLLMSGFALAVRDGLDACLLLVGPDWQNGRRTLEKLQQSLQLERSVFFWGASYGHEKFDLLKGADFFVHPSRWEGMSFSVIEAMACRKICLVSPEADPGGFIAQYSAGCLTDLNPESIASEMRDLAMMAPSDLETLRCNADRLVRQELGWQNITKVIVNAYRRFGNIY